MYMKSLKLTYKCEIFYIAMGIFFFVLFLRYIWNFTVDDAYIPMRYAENLVLGHGLVWNVNEIPIEGYSNFLWVLIIAAILFFKLDPTFYLKILGLISLVSIGYIYWIFFKQIFKKQKKEAYLGFSIVILLLLANPATAIHAVSGLETMLYSFLILTLTFIGFKIIHSNKNKYYWIFSFLALLTSLLRFEGILVSCGIIFLIFFYNYYTQVNSPKINKSYLFPFLIVFIIPLMFYMLFRYFYFNEFFPLPFFVKSLTPTTSLWFIKSSESWIESLKYLAPFIITILFGVLLTIKNRNNLVNNTFKSLFILLMVAGVTIFFANIIYLPTSLIMNYADRFFYPSYILIYLICGAFLAMLFKELEVVLHRKYLNKLNALAGILLVFMLLVSNTVFLSELSYYHSYDQKLKNTQIDVGQSLKPFSNYNYTIASDFAGALPYYSSWKDLDILGLNDKFIAKNGMATSEYLEEKKPELVILPFRNRKIAYSYNYEKPFYDFVKKNNYVIINTLYWDNISFVFYLNPKIGKFNEIKKAILSSTSKK